MSEDGDAVLCCSICYEVPEEIGIITCQHIYCYKCIQEWSGKSTKCPQCRRQFTEIARLQVDTEEVAEAETPYTDARTVPGEMQDVFTIPPRWKEPIYSDSLLLLALLDVIRDGAETVLAQDQLADSVWTRKRYLGGLRFCQQSLRNALLLSRSVGYGEIVDALDWDNDLQLRLTAGIQAAEALQWGHRIRRRMRGIQSLGNMFRGRRQLT